MRIQPTGYQVFPEYDLGLQFRTMQLLAKTDVPVPRVLWLEEEDRDVLGAPFYVMDARRGPRADRPAAVPHRRLDDGDLAGRARGDLVGRHRVHGAHPPPRSDARRLRLPRAGRSSARRRSRQQLAYYERYLEWAARGRAAADDRGRARAGSGRTSRDDPRRVLVWGDARIGNIIFDGTRPAAVLDWEMVTLGSPEEDLAWAIFLDRHHSEGIERRRASRASRATRRRVARYEALTGHRVRHLHYYQVFAGFRFAVIMMRIAQQMVHYEVMKPEQGRQFELDNTVTRLLAKAPRAAAASRSGEAAGLLAAEVAPARLRACGASSRP